MAIGKASGGGSGGAILVAAPVVTLSANGGAGGETQGRGYAYPDDVNGMEVAVLGPAPGGMPNGGAGSAPTLPAGVDAAYVVYDSVGGGGGAGRISINTTSGAAAITGAMSRDITTSCVNQATLTAR